VLALARHGDNSAGRWNGADRLGGPGDAIGQQQPARAKDPVHLADHTARIVVHSEETQTAVAKLASGKAAPGVGLAQVHAEAEKLPGCHRRPPGHVCGQRADPGPAVGQQDTLRDRRFAPVPRHSAGCASATQRNGPTAPRRHVHLRSLTAETPQ
jgi:hypothetical protein